MVHQPNLHVDFLREALNRDLAEVAGFLGLAAIGCTPADHRVWMRFPHAATVLSIAVSCLPSGSACSPFDADPGIARFAMSIDYHTHVTRAMDVIVPVLRSYGASYVNTCVDDSYLDERALARQAGLGSIGRNGLLFVDGCGSWVSIGEILTDIPCESGSEPKPSMCSGCRMCVQACPTGALSDSGALDATRCISALTQKNWPFSAKSAEAMGCRLYGCDVCQEVCPYNQGIEPTNPAFSVAVYPEWLGDAGRTATMSQKEYRAALRNTPIGWIGRNRLRRNAIISIGNSQNQTAAACLPELLEDPGNVIREAAAWAMLKIGG